MFTIDRRATDIRTGDEYVIYKVASSFRRSHAQAYATSSQFALADGTRLSLQPNGTFIAAGGEMVLKPIGDDEGIRPRHSRT